MGSIFSDYVVILNGNDCSMYVKIVFYVWYLYLDFNCQQP